MHEALGRQWAMADQDHQDQRISEAIRRDQARLRNFIRRSVPDPGDAEDILQEVFCELVEAYRMTKPIEQVTAWLFRVARNRIIDLFRRRAHEPPRAEQTPASGEQSRGFPLDLLPSTDAGPEAAYARRVLLEELVEALGELPEEQRVVFIAHELLGKSFKTMAEETGVSINTLLSRKHYAVLYLRRRLRDMYGLVDGSGPTRMP